MVLTRKQLVDQLHKQVQGEVSTRRKTLKSHSVDASLFKLEPKVVVFPQDSADIKNLVKYAAKQKPKHKELSLTVRSGGTDMSGGAINDSIIVDVSRYMHKLGKVGKDKTIRTQPGVFYRDFERRTLAQNLIMPSYPASRELCTVGGMVANNAGGEKSLIYGKTAHYVSELKVILRDGKEYAFQPISKAELKKKVKQKTLEGRLYRDVARLIKNNRQAIEDSRPKVSKNSTGYNIWEVWDGEQFDLTKLFVGSQGTLGIITDIKFKLVKAKPLSGMVVLFLPDQKQLGSIINKVLRVEPSSFESFDEHTLKFALRFFLTFRKALGLKRFIGLGLSFIPLIGKLARYFPNLPNMIMLVEFEGDTQKEIDEKIAQTLEEVSQFRLETYIADDKKHEAKFWTMRRESFNLLRKNVRKKHTAPFIDDLVVPPRHLPEFLPKLTKILNKYKLLYTVAGHMGDGNFHVIPLMDLSDPAERAKIPKGIKEVTKLVLEYEGSLSGEHNDGMIRGPFLSDMFSKPAYKVQKQIKRIFDPQNIFNTHKKTDADWEFSKRHIKRGF